MNIWYLHKSKTIVFSLIAIVQAESYISNKMISGLVCVIHSSAGTCCWQCASTEE